MSLLQEKNSNVNTLTTNGETRNTLSITHPVSVNSTPSKGIQFKTERVTLAELERRESEGRGKFKPTSKRNPCPVCGDTSGKCRTTGGDLVLCMTHDQPIPGWHYLGQSKDYLWGKFVPQGDRPAPVRVEKREPEPKLVRVTDELKHRNYSAILERTHLNDRHLEDFVRRGLSESEIAVLSARARSLSHGYIIPFPNVDGLLCGAQIRRDSSDKGRYRWYTYRDDHDKHNEFGELPLAVYRGRGEAWIIEGTGVKPIVANIRHGITAIGAAGGQHYLSPKTFSYTLAKLGNPNRVVFCPDAGDILNPHVLRRIKANLEYLEGLGLTVTIAWWGQDTKDKPDIDELENLDDVRYISPQEFWKLPDPKLIKKIFEEPIAVEPKSKAQQKREWRAIQEEITRKEIIKPFGDRPYDITTATKEELEEAILNNPYSFIDGPTGTGKTEAFKVLLGDRVNHLGFSPLRSLARGAAAALGQPYWNENRKGVLDSAWACIHSVLAVTNAERVYDRSYLYLDEVEQSLEALITSKLCEENREARITALQAECSSAERIVAASATAALKDLNYLEAISGKRFTLIRFDPQLHQKGSFTIYTAQEGVKGSNQAALNHVRSLTALPKSYVASDSSNKTIETLIRSDVPTMLINQRTAGDDDEVKVLMSSPDPGMSWKSTGYSNLVASPTVQSGFSIKGEGLFDQVLGVFTGRSISPSNCVQQLERYRSSVPRICYAPRYSAPPSSIGTGRSPRGVGSFKERQTRQWQLEADHLQNTVRTGAFTGFKYLVGAEREWYGEWEIQRDREFRNFAVAVEAYATRQGFKVEYAVAPLDSQCESLKDEVNDWKATPIFTRGNDRPLHKVEVSDLLADGKELSQEEIDRLEAYAIRDYYGLAWDAPLTKELIIDEGFGDGRKALRKALRILWSGQAEADDQARRDRLGDSGYIWDVSNHALTIKFWDRLGIDDVLAFCLENPYSSASPEIRAFSDRLANCQEELGEGSKLLGVKIPWKGEDAQEHYGKVVKWIGMLLKSLGIETKSHRVRDDFGNVLPRVYSIVPESLERLREALDHKVEKQIQQGFTPRSTPLWNVLNRGVDQDSTPGQFLSIWNQYRQAIELEDEDLALKLAETLDNFQEF